MFWLNLSILIATAGCEWCASAAAEVVTAAGQVGRRSDSRRLRLRPTEMRAGPSTARAAAVPWRSRLSAGFFRRRPNGIDRRPATDVTTNYDYIDGGGSANAATPTAAAGRILLFGTEDECVSANGGRACVCFMTDFLDLIVQRLDETVGGEDGTAIGCHSFRPVPAAFLVHPAFTTAAMAAAVPANVSADVAVERNGGKSGGGGGGGGGVHVEKKAADATSWRVVDFDDVVDYRLEKSPDDHYAVQYGLVGSDAKVPCVINGNGTRMNAFKWDFKKDKHKTNSTVVGTDTNILLILGLEPGDSKNYTCIPTRVGDSKNGTSYKHYVVAVEKAIYEIRGSVVYKTRGGGGCTHDVTVLVQKQLPSSMRNELCPEGSSRYACNVTVEKPKCAEDERTMEIKYLVTLNDKANYLARIRTSKKGRIAQRYQKLLARISSVLASNLNKTLTVPIISKLSLIDTNFESDSSRVNVKKFVSCTPGFGIREVFCAACPPHHYSPDKSTECLKCVKGFHQPVAGSEKCIKCRSIFSSGCYVIEVSPRVYYFTGLVCLLVCSILAISCAFCCREENEKSIRIIPRKIRKKFKKTKKYSVLSSSQMEDTPDSSYSSVIKQKASKLKNLLKLKKKSKSKIVDSKITFNSVHEKFGERIQNNHVTNENSTTD